MVTPIKRQRGEIFAELDHQWRDERTLAVVPVGRRRTPRKIHLLSTAGSANEGHDPP